MSERASIVGLAAMVALSSAIACARPRPGTVPRACGPGETVLLGACVPRAPAEACERGRARDLDRGACATARDVRATARAGGVFVGDEDIVICASDADELVMRSGRLACVARARPSASCPPASVRDGPEGPAPCAPLVVDELVDLARFARAAAAYVCDAIAAQPSSAGPSEERFRIELALRAPDNDPTQATAIARTSPALDVDLEPALAVVLDALRRVAASSSREGGRPRGTTATDVEAALACSRTSRRPKSAAPSATGAAQAQPE